MKELSAISALLVALATSSCHRHSHAKTPHAVASSGDSSPAPAPAIAESEWTHEDAPAGGAAHDALSGKCTIPVHKDDYYGFTVGRPNGWRIDYSTDNIVVSKDEKNLVGALIFPARLRRNDIPPERLATLFVQNLASKFARKGGTVQLTEQKTNGSVATAVILATLDGVDLKGPLEVVERPGFVTLKLYWAPTADFDKEEPTLKQVLTCFQRKTLITSKKPVAPAGGPVNKIGFASKPGASAPTGPVQPLRPYHGRFFLASMPAGWKVQDEGPHGIDLISADGTEAAGLGFIIVNATSDASPVLQASVRQMYPQARVLQAGAVPAGPGWSVAAAEWQGPVQGAVRHGIDRVAVGRGIQISTSWLSSPERWPSAKATLGAIAASIQILPGAIAQVNQEVRAQIASYPHPTPSSAAGGSSSSSSDDLMSSWSSREASEDHSNRAFDDYIRGNDRATSPTTGEEYVVPTSAWNDTGPQGAGYYRETPGGGAELLNVEPPASESPP